MRFTLRPLPALVLATAALAGCSRPAPAGEAVPAGEAGPGPASLQDKVATPAGAAAQLAITRRVQVELPTARIAPLYQSLQSACAADTADACVVLRASLDTGAWTHAELSLRAAPAGVGKLLDRLHGTGGVWQEAMEGEDLAAPIVDGERRIAMLRDYRDSLLALRARQGTTIDALIRINSELAQAQSQLETAAGEAAHLRQRVDTQVLAVAIAPPAGERRATPVADALHRFGGNFAHAAAGVVTFVAWALPWLLLLVPLAWGLRRLRARWRRGRGG